MIKEAMNETNSDSHKLTEDDISAFDTSGAVTRKLFDLIGDIEADPINELTEIHLLTEESFNDPDYQGLLKPEDLSKDRFDRARYGVSRRDLWNFNSHFLSIMAHGFRRLRDIETDETRKDVFNRLVDGCIALHEHTATNDMAYYADEEKRKAEQKRWENTWIPKVKEFQKLLNAEWMTISGQPSAWTWNRPSVDALLSKLEEPFAYDEKKDYLSDPITLGVPEEERNLHLTQRAVEGYSDWDLNNFRTYLVWLLAQSSLFFASKDAMGWPVTEERPTFEDHSAFLIKFAADMLYGEAAMCITRAQEFNRIPEWNANYAVAVAKFTEVIPGMWD